MNNLASPAETVTVSRLRRWLVCAFGGVLVIGHALDVATSSEHWPISCYPMYARLHATPSFQMIRLVGLTVQDPPREVPLDSPWLRSNFSRIARAADAPARLLEAVETYAGVAGWDRPEDFGPFAAYRIYEQHWTLRADVHPIRPPDHATLLVELRRPTVGEVARVEVP